MHHEDVRRAAPDWEPRALSDGESDMLWQRLRMARFMLRKAPVGVELARDDIDTGGVSADGPAYRITAKNATPAVTVVGSPAELTMWVMGRTDRGAGPHGRDPGGGDQARRGLRRRTGSG